VSEKAEVQFLYALNANSRHRIDAKCYYLLVIILQLSLEHYKVFYL